MNGNLSLNSIQAGSWSFRSRFHQYRYLVHCCNLFGLEYPYVYGAQKQNDTKPYGRRLHLFVCDRLLSYRRSLSVVHFGRLGGWCRNVSVILKQHLKPIPYTMAFFNRRKERDQSRLQKTFKCICEFLVGNVRQAKTRQR